MKALVSLLAVLALASTALGLDSELVARLQAQACTVQTQMGSGSGVVVVGDRGKAFVWTAAHVVEDLRYTETAEDGTKTQSFREPTIIMETRQNGRLTGEATYKCRVMLVSSSEDAKDLALLEVLATNILPRDQSAVFYLEDNVPAVGTELYHVGSMEGHEWGSESLTAGILSQVGRDFEFGGDTLFDQTDTCSHPGSSGGGMFLREDGRYVGMLVRGWDEGLNYMIPVREMRAYVKEMGVEWALDPRLPTPSDEELAKLKPAFQDPIEDYEEYYRYTLKYFFK